MKGKNNFIIIFTILSFTISAQSKYGMDENACKENLSMFREYYKQKNYQDALSPWRWAFKTCPASSGNIYKNGPKIIKERIKLDKQNKEAYIDTLMMIFDQRLKYGFGEEGYILGLKGYELLLADKSRSNEAFMLMDQGIKLSGNKSDFRTVYGYMKAAVNLEKRGEKSKEDVLNVYNIISNIISYNINNQSKVTKYFIQYSEKIENLFTPYANCDDLINLFSKKFDSSKENVSELKRIVEILDSKDCNESDLFFKATEALHILEPSSMSADKMSKMCILKGNSSNAVSFAKEAISLEEDLNQKAKYYLTLADAYRSIGSYSSARSAVYSSLEIRKDWGEAYMSLGNIYISGANQCGSDFEKTTVYWVAVDAFQKALKDEETQLRASKSINTYSKYFPTKETCFFNGIESGSKHMVECWINKNTTVRTID